MNRQKTTTHRDAAKGRGDRNYAEPGKRTLCSTRHKILSMLRGASAKCHRLFFKRVLGLQFRSSDSKASKEALSTSKETRMNLETSAPFAHADAALSVDMVSRPAFIFNSPIFGPLSASQSAHSTSKASTNHQSESKTDCTRWSFMDGDSSFIVNSDGSNDDDPLTYNRGCCVAEVNHGLSSNEVRGIPPSSHRLCDIKGESAMIPGPTDPL